MAYSSLKWPLLDSRGLKWPQVGSNTLSDIKWPQIVSSRLKWPQEWPQVASSNLKWPQIDSSEWLEVDYNGFKWLKWSLMTQTDLKESIIALSGLKWPQITSCGHIWPQIAKSCLKWHISKIFYNVKLLQPMIILENFSVFHCCS